MYKFAAAAEDESIVFGAAKPKSSDAAVKQWIEFMRDRRIDRVCCLLTARQLDRYSDLLGSYDVAFGIDRVCRSPIEDFHLVDPDILCNRILPFLFTANRQQQKVVVHCAGGIGRTGQILAAWLVAGRGLLPAMAISTVKRMGRNPHEAVIFAPLMGKNPWQVAAEFNLLLDRCTALTSSLMQ